MGIVHGIKYAHQELIYIDLIYSLTLDHLLVSCYSLMLLLMLLYATTHVISFCPLSSKVCLYICMLSFSCFSYSEPPQLVMTDGWPPHPPSGSKTGSEIFRFFPFKNNALPKTFSKKTQKMTYTNHELKDCSVVSCWGKSRSRLKASQKRRTGSTEHVWMDSQYRHNN